MSVALLAFEALEISTDQLSKIIVIQNRLNDNDIVTQLSNALKPHQDKLNSVKKHSQVVGLSDLSYDGPGEPLSGGMAKDSDQEDSLLVLS